MKPGVMAGLTAIGTLLVFASAADAQYRERPRGYFGVSFVAADPVGELGSFIEQGFGGQIEAGGPVAAGGHLRMRAELGFLIYGLERLDYCYTYSCRVASELTTTNSIIYGGVGPELVLATGAVEPYVHATAGLTGFVTSSSLNDHDGFGPYLETTNYSDVVFGWKAGGGVRLRVGHGHKPVHLDFGVDHHDNGIASYLTKGDIVDNPDGSVTVYPNQSEADLLTFRFGVTFAIGGGDEHH